MKALTIAVDGYASCGKSTLSKDLASALGYRYIDSGAMYRAVTWYLLQHRLEAEEGENLQRALSDIAIDFVTQSGETVLLLNGKEPGLALRSKEVNSMVSPVSALHSVRQTMVQRQREFATQAGLTMDGRDIGTYVFPNAELKIFMQSRPEVRAARRLAELQNAGDTKWTVEEVLVNLRERDEMDSNRDFAPLRRAHDAIDLDNSDMNREEQLAWAMDLAIARGAQQP
ncbi:MAG: (d)CMP kinase [Sphingomonadales bacterium]|nr:(d)CMP kinase [Sphingomonadales bacterium]